MEQWRWVEGFEDIYKVSSEGRILSFKSDPSGRLLSLTNQKDGYQNIVLKAKGHTTRFARIHVLVVEAFMGPVPSGCSVHHIDGNKCNNAVENLQVLTFKEHFRKTVEQNPRVLSGVIDYNRFEKARPVSQYDLAGNWIGTYCSVEFAGEFTGVCSKNIYLVASRRPYKDNKVRKQAGGYLWKYADESGVIANEV